jgi:hypothetical protein
MSPTCMHELGLRSDLCGWAKPKTNLKGVFGMPLFFLRHKALFGYLDLIS